MEGPWLRSDGALMRRYMVLLRILMVSGLLMVAWAKLVPAHADERHQQGRAERLQGDIHAVLYMTSWCPYCRKAREYLTGLGVSLTEYDVEKDSARKADMIRLSGSAMVPLIDIDGILIRGFVPDEIDAALAMRRKALSINKDQRRQGSDADNLKGSP